MNKKIKDQIELRKVLLFKRIIRECMRKINLRLEYKLWVERLIKEEDLS